jgi:glycosyltransferase involved in cell wall biosynthesis
MAERLNPSSERPGNPTFGGVDSITPVNGRPTVGVVIPTLNSSATIAACLVSVREQSYPVSDIVVVDGLSSDGTPEIARKFARVLELDAGGTQARFVGAKTVGTDLVLSLDSDQVIARSAIESAIATGCRVVAFGETCEGPGLVAKINGVDFRLINRHWSTNIGMIGGPIRPRLYPTSMFLRGLGAIPERIRRTRPSPFSEDTLIFVGSGAAVSEVGYVPTSIKHIESLSLWAYALKWYRYGKSARPYRQTQYEYLPRVRGSRRGMGFHRVGTFPALITRGIPFLIGYGLG